MTTRGRRLPVRLRALANRRTRRAVLLLTLTEIRRLARILCWLVLTTETVIGLRFFAVAASSPPAETLPAGRDAAARQQPASAIVTGFGKRAEATVRPVDVCYRHPSRETGVACSNCGRAICPDCMTSTSVGMRCPECAGQTTTVRKVASARADEPMLTYVLLGVIGLVHLGAMSTGADAGGSGLGESRLLTDGAVSRPTIADGELWRLLTSGFLHSGLPHLFLNGISLWILGSMIEPAVGRARFAVIFFVSLLAGSFGVLLLEPDSRAVGASGAVFGLMGAAIIVLRRRGIGLMESGLGFWLGLNLVLTFRPGISIGGHLGGLAGGLLVALILFELRDRVQVPRWAPMALAGALGVAVVIGSVVVAG